MPVFCGWLHKRGAAILQLASDAGPQSCDKTERSTIEQPTIDSCEMLLLLNVIAGPRRPQVLLT